MLQVASVHVDSALLRCTSRRRINANNAELQRCTITAKDFCGRRVALFYSGRFSVAAGVCATVRVCVRLSVLIITSELGDSWLRCLA